MIILKKYTKKEDIDASLGMSQIVCGNETCEIVSKDVAIEALNGGKIVFGLLNAKIPYAYSVHTIELENYAGTVSAKFKFDITIDPSSGLSDLIRVELARGFIKTEWSETEIFGSVFDKCSSRISSWLAEKLDGVEAHLVKKYQSQAVADVSEFAELASVIPAPLKATLTDIEFFTTDAESKRTTLTRSYGIPESLIDELVERFVSIDDVEKILFEVKESSTISGTRFLDTLNKVIGASTSHEAMVIVSEIKDEFVKVNKFKEEFGVETIADARKIIAECGGANKAFSLYRAALDIKNNCPVAKPLSFEKILEECKAQGPDAVRYKYRGAGFARIGCLGTIIVAAIVGFFVWKNSFCSLTIQVDGSPVAFEKICAEELGGSYTISDSGLFEASIKKSKKSDFLEKIADSDYDLISSSNPNSFTAREKLSRFTVKVFLRGESEYARVVDAMNSVEGSMVYSKNLVKGGFGTFIAEISVGSSSTETALSADVVAKLTSAVSSVSRNDIKIAKE